MIETNTSTNYGTSLCTILINAKENILDLAATGLATTSHSENFCHQWQTHFNQFILHAFQVHPEVREVTGISEEDKKMYHNEREQKAVNIISSRTCTSCLNFFFV